MRRAPFGPGAEGRWGRKVSIAQLATQCGLMAVMAALRAFLVSRSKASLGSFAHQLYNMRWPRYYED